MSVRNILVVDDEVDICYLISSVLNKAGKVNIETAGSLRSATDKIDSFTPNVVFLDNHLVDGMGVEYISTIKKKCKDCKVIMVSAYDTTLDKMKAIKNGADAFVSKPFTRHTILNILGIV